MNIDDILAERGTVTQIKPREPRIRLTPFHEIKLGTKPRYLVDTLIPLVGFSVIWGEPKCGKSFWAFNLLMHVARGEPYRGLAVQGGPVVYCAFEGQSGFGARAEAYRKRFEPKETDIPLYLVTTNLDLVNDVRELIDAIRTQIGDVKPIAVALDTLNRSLRGSENSDEDMGAWVAAADAIREAFDCAVIAIHHCGHEGKRPRGHSSLTASADIQIKVYRDGADNVVAEVEVAKDGPQGHSVLSRLEVVEVGVDDDGTKITSCVIVPVDGAATSTETARRKLSNNQALALRALSDLINTSSQPFRLKDGTEVAAVATDRWRQELMDRGVIDRDARNPRSDFKRIRESLKARNLIAERDDKLWLV